MYSLAPLTFDDPRFECLRNFITFANKNKVDHVIVGESIENRNTYWDNPTTRPYIILVSCLSTVSTKEVQNMCKAQFRRRGSPEHDPTVWIPVVQFVQPGTNGVPREFDFNTRHVSCHCSDNHSIPIIMFRQILGAKFPYIAPQLLLRYYLDDFDSNENNLLYNKRIIDLLREIVELGEKSSCRMFSGGFAAEASKKIAKCYTFFSNRGSIHISLRELRALRSLGFETMTDELAFPPLPLFKLPDCFTFNSCNKTPPHHSRWLGTWSKEQLLRLINWWRETAGIEFGIGGDIILLFDTPTKEENVEILETIDIYVNHETLGPDAKWVNNVLDDSEDIYLAIDKESEAVYAIIGKEYIPLRFVEFDHVNKEKMFVDRSISRNPSRKVVSVLSASSCLQNLIMAFDPIENNAYQRYYYERVFPYNAPRLCRLMTTNAEKFWCDDDLKLMLSSKIEKLIKSGYLKITIDHDYAWWRLHGAPLSGEFEKNHPVKLQDIPPFRLNEFNDRLMLEACIKGQEKPSPKPWDYNLSALFEGGAFAKAKVAAMLKQLEVPCLLTLLKQLDMEYKLDLVLADPRVAQLVQRPERKELLMNPEIQAQMKLYNLGNEELAVLRKLQKVQPSDLQRLLKPRELRKVVEHPKLRTILAELNKELSELSDQGKLPPSMGSDKEEETAEQYIRGLMAQTDLEDNEAEKKCYALVELFSKSPKVLEILGKWFNESNASATLHILSYSIWIRVYGATRHQLLDELVEVHKRARLAPRKDKQKKAEGYYNLAYYMLQSALCTPKKPKAFTDAINWLNQAIELQGENKSFRAKCLYELANVYTSYRQQYPKHYNREAAGKEIEHWQAVLALFDSDFSPIDFSLPIYPDFQLRTEFKIPDGNWQQLLALTEMKLGLAIEASEHPSINDNLRRSISLLTEAVSHGFNDYPVELPDGTLYLNTTKWALAGTCLRLGNFGVDHVPSVERAIEIYKFDLYYLPIDQVIQLCEAYLMLSRLTIKEESRQACYAGLELIGNVLKKVLSKKNPLKEHIQQFRKFIILFGRASYCSLALGLNKRQLLSGLGVTEREVLRFQSQLEGNLYNTLLLEYVMAQYFNQLDEQLLKSKLMTHKKAMEEILSKGERADIRLVYDFILLCIKFEYFELAFEMSVEYKEICVRLYSLESVSTLDAMGLQICALNKLKRETKEEAGVYWMVQRKLFGKNSTSVNKWEGEI